MNANTEQLFDRPLPERIDMERLVIGAALTDAEAFPQIADLLLANDFTLEKHRRIFLCCGEIYSRGEEINYVSLWNELVRRNQGDSVDGLSYISSLSDGMPHLVNLAGYCALVRHTSIKRQAITSMAAMMERCYNPAEETGDILADVERVTELLNSSDRRDSFARTTEQVIADAGGLDAFLAPHKNPGIEVPFTAINATLSGLRKSKFILLGARPAVGKTALASQIAEHAAAIGKTVLFVTLEMSAEDVIKRSITGDASIGAYRFREGLLSCEERSRLQTTLSARTDLGEHLLYVDKSDITLQGVASLLQSLRARGKAVDLCVIDYLQLLSSVGRFETRAQEVSNISRGLKKITQRFGIPVLALSQLTRKEDHRKNDRPELDWLKESGQLEQDADQVVFLWSKKDAEEGDSTREIHWRVAKNRDGVLNNGVLTFQTRYCRFAEASTPIGSVA